MPDSFPQKPRTQRGAWHGSPACTRKAPESWERVAGGLQDRSVGGSVGGRAPWGREETHRPGVLGSEEEQDSSDFLGETAKLRPLASKGEHAVESGSGTSSRSVPPAQPRRGCGAEVGSTCGGLTRVLQSLTFPGVCHTVTWDRKADAVRVAGSQSDLDFAVLN